MSDIPNPNPPKPPAIQWKRSTLPFIASGDSTLPVPPQLTVSTTPEPALLLSFRGLIVSSLPFTMTHDGSGLQAVLKKLIDGFYIDQVLSNYLATGNESPVPLIAVLRQQEEKFVITYEVESWEIKLLGGVSVATRFESVFHWLKAKLENRTIRFTLKGTAESFMAFLTEGAISYPVPQTGVPGIVDLDAVEHEELKVLRLASAVEWNHIDFGVDIEGVSL